MEADKMKKHFYRIVLDVINVKGGKMPACVTFQSLFQLSQDVKVHPEDWPEFIKEQLEKGFRMDQMLKGPVAFSETSSVSSRHTFGRRF